MAGQGRQGRMGAEFRTTDSSPLVHWRFRSFLELFSRFILESPEVICIRIVCLLVCLFNAST
jgi:hypothetical protein